MCPGKNKGALKRLINGLMRTDVSMSLDDAAYEARSYNDFDLARILLIQKRWRMKTNYRLFWKLQSVSLHQIYVQSRTVC